MFPKKLVRQPSQGPRRLQVREVTGMPDHREPHPEPRFGLTHPVRAADNDPHFALKPHGSFLATSSATLRVQPGALARRNVSMIVGPIPSRA